MCDPEGCATVLGVEGGGPPPWLTQTLGVSGSGGQPLGSLGGGGGSVGTPKNIPQNDPHVTLIILNMHKWGKIFFTKNFAHQLRLPSAKVRPGGRVGVKILLCVFTSIFEFSIKF